MLGGLLGRSSAGLRLLRNVTLAFVPIAVIGLLLHDLIDKYLFSTRPEVLAELAGIVARGIGAGGGVASGSGSAGAAAIFREAMGSADR